MLSKSIIWAAAIPIFSTIFDPAQANQFPVWHTIDADAEEISSDPNTSDKPLSDWERENPERIAEIDAAMRLIADDPALADRLPLPDHPSSFEIKAALRHPAAWKTGQVVEDKAEIFDEIVFRGAYLIASEESCNTGMKNLVSQNIFDALDKYFTLYPQRLYLASLVDWLDIIDDDTDRQCSLKDLERRRAVFQNKMEMIEKPSE